MSDCVFCKIVAGKLPSVIFWENKEFLAILDINPNVDGASLVISKNHINSDFTQIATPLLNQGVSAAQQVAQILQEKLPVKRVGLVIEGIGVPHFHIKLYPMPGYPEATSNNTSRVKFAVFPGFITTQLGPQARIDDLNKLGETLRIN